MPSAQLADGAQAMLRRRRKQEQKASEASRRLGRAEADLEQARHARAAERAKAAGAARVNRTIDQVEARNDIRGLIADVFGYTGSERRGEPC